MDGFNYKIVNVKGYRAIGLKWDGSYNEISSLKEIISTMKERVQELNNTVTSDVQLGLSYHLRPDGFVHYSVYEVEGEQEIPKGMIEIYVPEMTYLTAHHEKGQDVGQTYMNIAKWLSESDYEAFRDPDRKYFDELPIKHERYPKDQHPEDPHFDIFIPIVKKN